MGTKITVWGLIAFNLGLFIFDTYWYLWVWSVFK